MQAQVSHAHRGSFRLTGGRISSWRRGVVRRVEVGTPPVHANIATNVSTDVLELDVAEYFSGPSKTTLLGNLVDYLFPAPVRFIAAWATPIAALIAIHPAEVLHGLGAVLSALTSFSPALQAICQNLNQPIARWLMMAVLSTAGLLFSFVIVPLLDWLTGEEGPADSQPTVPNWHQVLYRFILHGYVALHMLVLASAAHMAATTHLPPLMFLLLVMNVSCSGAVGFTTAHELIHSKHKADRVIADALLTCMCYPHWAHSHIAHHIQVATPTDPASARYKESVYQFIPRSVVGNWRDAVHMESERLAQKGLPYPWCLQNRVFSWIAAPTCVAAGMYAMFGMSGLLLHLSAAAGSIFFLETINYVEHYGLRRRQLPSGKFESVSEHHSWNANTFFANSAYFRLQRHTHHHMHASKPYWALENVEGAPKLPGSYPTMILLALLPPVFFTVMNPRVHIYQLLGDLSGGKGRERTSALSAAAAP